MTTVACKFDLGGYSQDIRNCEKCHDPANAATPQAGLWKTNPNRLACGSCHDGIDFATGVGLTLADKAAGLSVSTGFFGKAHPGQRDRCDMPERGLPRRG